MSNAICARGLTKHFGDGEGRVDVLRGIDLDLTAGDSLAIVGPSGSGKSTLLHLLGALEKPDSGSLSVNGVEMARLSGKSLARFRNRTVGFVFQDHHLLPQCTALENVLIPLLPIGGVNAESTRRAETLLERVGLSGRKDHKPAELSGGERQRVAVARALINEPGVLLCDEPTGNLDRASALAVTGLLLELLRSTNAMLVYVTHSNELASCMQRVVKLSDGRLEKVN